MKGTQRVTPSNRRVSRRRFVTNLAATVAGTTALATQSSAKDAAPADNQPPGDMVDVLVVGGGTAGAIAAIQAARAGAKTALVEMGGQLGGTTTTGA
jgi:NADPH-dependent 2,4-dienoyl-CoA reductase/sulfur reductase-like enzyme